MKTPKDPEKRARTTRTPVIGFAIAAVILDVVAILLMKAGWYALETFSVWIAPPIEEAVKGGFASLLAVLYLTLYARGRLGGSGPLKWAVLAGVLSGVAFALSESLGQGESLLALGTSLYTHPIWATGVSIGCWSLILDGDKRLLTGIFPLAAAAHMSWNYYVQNPADLTRYLAALFIVVILAIIFWRYYHDKLSTS